MNPESTRAHISALRIPVTGPAEHIRLHPGGTPGFLTDLYRVIDTQVVEAVTLTGRWHAWVDEEGARRPVNHAATAIAHDCGMSATLHGTVILTGFHPRSGRARSLSPAQLDAIGRRLASRSQASR
ncbi:MAG TPA: DUF3846 domain-containing protein [Pseudonocardiaceae bacterium]|jgi:hypothetical protein|nr:DUF3846 domain-containing protein [Pseudonocardiaceae bacterium]